MRAVRWGMFMCWQHHGSFFLSSSCSVSCQHCFGWVLQRNFSLNGSVWKEEYNCFAHLYRQVIWCLLLGKANGWMDFCIPLDAQCARTYGSPSAVYLLTLYHDPTWHSDRLQYFYFSWPESRVCYALRTLLRLSLPPERKDVNGSDKPGMEGDMKTRCAM